MEDVAAGQAEFALEVRRRQHLPCDDRRAEVGGDLRHGIDRRVGCSLLVIGPVAALRQRLVEVLAEQARHVHAGRRERGVDGRRDPHLDGRLARPRAALGVVVGAIEVGERWRDQHRRAVVLALLPSGDAGEVGQLGERHVHAQGCRVVAVARGHAAHLVGQQRRVDQPVVEDARIAVGDHARGLDFAAIAQHQTAGHTAARLHLGHGRVDFDRRAGLLRDLGHGVADRAHAADGVAPGALLAVRFAEAVVKEHIGRAGRVDALEVTDCGQPAVAALDRLAFKIVAEEIGGRHRHQPCEHRLGVRRQVPCLQRRGRGRHQAVHATTQVGRRAVHQAADRLHDFGQVFAESEPALRVAGMQRVELAHVVLGVTHVAEVATVGQRREVVARSLHDLQACGFEAELGHDERAQQAGQVGAHRVAEAGVELFGDCCTADHVPRFEEADLEPLTGEVGGGGQAVVAGADDGDVVGGAHGGPFGMTGVED